MGAWRKPRVLAFVTWSYIAWSLVPVLYAVRGSFGTSFNVSIPTGFTLDSYRGILFDGGELGAAFWRSVRLALLTVAISVPMGACLALALRHFRVRAHGMIVRVLFLGIALPQVALAAALFYLFVLVLKIHLTTMAVFLGHVTLALPFTALVVYTRLLFLDPGLEEMALDLGASPGQVIRRVLLPLLAPALVVAGAVAFALSFNAGPISANLCIPNSCRTLPTLLGGRRSAGIASPPEFAISVIASLASILVFAAAVAAVRLSRPRGRA